MRNPFKITLFSLIILVFFNSVSAQHRKSNSATKDLLQGRDLTQYAQANFTCRFPNSETDCNERKFTDFVWKSWSEKIKSYAAITYLGIDASLTKHFFIEPTKQSQWRIVQRTVSNHALLSSKYNNLIEDIPSGFFVDRVEDKNKPDKITLVFKDKSGKIIKNF